MKLGVQFIFMENVGFYTQNELEELGFEHLGKNVLVSKKCSIYTPKTVSLGSNIRIDDFCVLSGNINIGNFVHIAAFCGIYAGNAGIEIEDFVGISSGCAIHAMTDDFSGEYLTNPTIDIKYKNIKNEKIKLEKHSLIGSGCRILPGVTVKNGTSIGAMSLVNKTTKEWMIYFGIPAKVIAARSKALLELEEKFIKEKKYG